MTVVLIVTIAAAIAWASGAFAVINTGLVLAGARSEFFNEFEKADVSFQDLSTRMVSNKDIENLRWLGMLPQVREFGAGRVATGLRSESYDIRNQKYESTLEVDRDEISDDQTGQINIRVAEMAEAAATHKDYLIGQLLTSGADAASLAYDGNPFFYATHASGASGNQSNTLTFNATDHTNVTSAEFRSAVIQALASMMGYKDDQGRPMSLNGKGLVAVVPPQLYGAALEAMSATMLANTTNVFAGLARVISFPYLTNGAKWYLLKTDRKVRPFIFQDREPIEFNALTENSEEGFKTEKFLYGVRARYRMAYGYWQYCVLTEFN